MIAVSASATASATASASASASASANVLPIEHCHGPILAGEETSEL